MLCHHTRFFALFVLQEEQMFRNQVFAVTSIILLCYQDNIDKEEVVCITLYSNASWT
jgi:hypothetical protein